MADTVAIIKYTSVGLKRKKKNKQKTASILSTGYSRFDWKMVSSELSDILGSPPNLTPISIWSVDRGLPLHFLLHITMQIMRMIMTGKQLDKMMMVMM